MKSKFDHLYNKVINENTYTPYIPKEQAIVKITKVLPNLSTDDLDEILSNLVDDETINTLNSRRNRISKIIQMLPRLNEEDINYIYDMLFDEQGQTKDTDEITSGGGIRSDKPSISIDDPSHWDKYK
jgi:hypothetical protein